MLSVRRKVHQTNLMWQHVIYVTNGEDSHAQISWNIHEENSTEENIQNWHNSSQRYFSYVMDINTVDWPEFGNVGASLCDQKPCQRKPK